MKFKKLVLAILIVGFHAKAFADRKAPACLIDAATGTKIQTTLTDLDDSGMLRNSSLQIVNHSDATAHDEGKGFCYEARDPRAAEVHAYVGATAALTALNKFLPSYLMPQKFVVHVNVPMPALDVATNKLILTDNAYFDPNDGQSYVSTNENMQTGLLIDTYATLVYQNTFDVLYGWKNLQPADSETMQGVSYAFAAEITQQPKIGASPAIHVEALRDLSVAYGFLDRSAIESNIVASMLWKAGRILGNSNQQMRAITEALVSTLHNPMPKYKRTLCNYFDVYQTTLKESGVATEKLTAIADELLARQYDHACVVR